MFNYILNLKNKGFTLAEILITLGIIGVVAALTLPIVMAKTEREINRQLLIKNYALLANAFREIGQEYQGFNLMPPPCTGASGGSCPVRGNAALVAELAKRISIIKTCRGLTYFGEDIFNCWQSMPMTSYNKQATFNDFSGIAWGPTPASSSAFVLANGATVIVYFNTSESSIFETITRGAGNYCTSGNYWNILFIDVNGPKGPNRLGIDIFAADGDPQRGLYPYTGRSWVDKNGVTQYPLCGGDFTCPRENSTTTNSDSAGHACTWQALMGFDY